MVATLEYENGNEVKSSILIANPEEIHEDPSRPIHATLHLFTWVREKL